MAFESIKAEFALLFGQMINEPKDPAELREFIQEKINSIKATGMPVPKDLLELQRRLEADFDV